ncbi:uncharacterized protein LOC126710613 isoform X1 [Quercus robur]|uniref:uncharacterized protein LOC126710613 isoform X1 n=1 Tax=Quercus robur TaxID=38942 RepID=UPI002162A484|nr:uncharacterized protein LOC126710613 isoform X1 [Quercus robur]
MQLLNNLKRFSTILGLLSIMVFKLEVARYVSYLTSLTPFRFLIYNDVHMFFILLSSIQQQGTCFGFVEFESASLMQSAIELTMTEGGFQDGLVIEMIALGAVETLVVGILAEAGAMGEMTLRGEVISQIELLVMLDGMKKLAIGSTKMVDGKATHQASQGSMS